MKIYKDIIFEAAHMLPNLPDGHKCKRLHGHSFKIRITVEGSINKSIGWVTDYADIKKAFAPIYRQLDHYYLNDIEGLENPTSENLAIWIWDRLSTNLENLFEIEVKETCSTGCIYRGN
ncbi:MAG: 6-carboxytetrahydropterin synthase QueD [Fidelibacterota bacterium]